MVQRQGEKCPKDNKPEYAFIGRSNVGKSSLINMLCNHKGLAKTSATPGKTLLINLFLVNREWYLVDLPGYGYAKVSKTEQEKWREIIVTYLSTRKNLKEIALIVDIRHEPTGQDLIMYEWIKSFGFRGIVVATKADKISKGNFHKNMKIIKDKLKIEKEDKELIIPYSAVNKTNIEKAWSIFESFL